MTDTKKKKPTITEMVNKAEKVGEAVKEFTPAEVDVLVDRGTQAAKLVKPFKDLFGGLFSRKSKLF
jgi:hypothetical protein